MYLIQFPSLFFVVSKSADSSSGVSVGLSEERKKMASIIHPRFNRNANLKRFGGGEKKIGIHSKRCNFSFPNYVFRMQRAYLGCFASEYSAQKETRDREVNEGGKKIRQSLLDETRLGQRSFNKNIIIITGALYIKTISFFRMTMK